MITSTIVNLQQEIVRNGRARGKALVENRQAKAKLKDMETMNPLKLVEWRTIDGNNAIANHCAIVIRSLGKIVKDLKKISITDLATESCSDLQKSIAITRENLKKSNPTHRPTTIFKRVI